MESARGARAGRPLPPLHEEWRASQRAIEPNLRLVSELRPSYKLAILSNADISLRERSPGVHRFYHLFDDIVCSAEVGMAKPEPAIFVLAAERLGLSSGASASSSMTSTRMWSSRGRWGCRPCSSAKTRRRSPRPAGHPRRGAGPLSAMPRTAIFLSPDADLAAAVDLARRADGAGYESVWVTHGLGRDGLQVLAAYAHAAPRVGLGTGVLPIYPRHPGAAGTGGARRFRRSREAGSASASA